MPNVPHYSSKESAIVTDLSLLKECVSLYYTENKAIGVMKPGHSFTIEPMINHGRYNTSLLMQTCGVNFHIGTWKDVTWPDDWTSTTAVSISSYRLCDISSSLSSYRTGSVQPSLNTRWS